MQKSNAKQIGTYPQNQTYMVGSNFKHYMFLPDNLGILKMEPDVWL